MSGTDAQVYCVSSLVFISYLPRCPFAINQLPILVDFHLVCDKKDNIYQKHCFICGKMEDVMGLGLKIIC